MALTLLSKPKRWSAAHLPLQFAFSYVIDVQAMSGSTQNYIAIGSTENRNGFFGIYPALFAGKFTVGQKFYIGTDTHLIQDKPVTIIEAYSSFFLSLGVNYPETYYKIDYIYDAQYPTLYLYSIDYVRTVDAAFQLYINDAYVGNIRYYREFSSGQLILDISAELAASFGEVQSPVGLGVDNNCFKKYRLDYGIASNITTGIDYYAINSVIEPLNPPCSDTLPNWQFDLITLMCEVAVPAPLFSANWVYAAGAGALQFERGFDTHLNNNDLVYLVRSGTLLFTDAVRVYHGIQQDTGNGKDIQQITGNNSTGYLPVVATGAVDVYKDVPFVSKTTGNRLARKKDINPLSATYNLYANSGQYFFYDVNTSACSITYYNKVQSQQFRKNNCSSGVGTFVNYTVAANAYTSIISQTDADSKALADIATNGQTYANTNGTCGSIHATIETRNQIYNASGDGSYDSFGDVYLVLKDGNGLPITKTISINIRNSITLNPNPSTNNDYVVNMVSASEYLLEGNLDFESFNSTTGYAATQIYFVLSGTGYVTP